MAKRLRRGTELEDQDWVEAYAEAAKYDEELRQKAVRDVIVVLETLVEIGYFTLDEECPSVELIADEIVSTLEGHARDFDAMVQTWTDHRGRP